MSSIEFPAAQKSERERLEETVEDLKTRAEQWSGHVTNLTAQATALNARLAQLRDAVSLEEKSMQKRLEELATREGTEQHSLKTATDNARAALAMLDAQKQNKVNDIEKHIGVIDAQRQEAMTRLAHVTSKEQATSLKLEVAQRKLAELKAFLA